MEDRNSVGYTQATTPIEDKEVMDFFNALIREGTPTGRPIPGPGGRPGKGTQYRLREDYDVFSNNCCTKTKDGLEQIGIYSIKTYKPNEAFESMEKGYKGADMTRTEYNRGGEVRVTYQSTGRSKSIEVKAFEPVKMPRKETDIFT